MQGDDSFPPVAMGGSRSRDEGDEADMNLDAALIDSFFLPGGILDPDDDEKEDETSAMLKTTPFSTPRRMNRVPSNPWSSESNDSAILGYQSPSKPQQDYAPSPTRVAANSAPGFEASSTDRASNNGRTTFGETAAILRPPPGYSDEDRFPSNPRPGGPVNDDIFSPGTSLFGQGRRTESADSLLDLFPAETSGRLAPVSRLEALRQIETPRDPAAGMNNGPANATSSQHPAETLDPSEDVSNNHRQAKTRRLRARASKKDPNVKMQEFPARVQHPSAAPKESKTRSKQQAKSEAVSKSTTHKEPRTKGGKKINAKNQVKPIEMFTRRNAPQLKSEKNSSGVPTEERPPPKEQTKTSRSKKAGKSKESNNKEGKAKPPARNDAPKVAEEKKTVEKCSPPNKCEMTAKENEKVNFPIEMLTVEHADKRGSTTSSISTSSNGSIVADDPISSTSVDKLALDNEEGDGSLNSSVDSREVEAPPELTDEMDGTESPVLETQTEVIPTDESSHKVSDAKVNGVEGEMSQPKPPLSTLLVNMMIQLVKAGILEPLHRLYASFMDRFSIWLQTFQSFATLLGALKEVMKTFVFTAFHVITRILLIGSKTFFVLGSLMIQAGKYALVEILEEKSVAMSYVIFYALPGLCSSIMARVIAPHWTPHFLTTAAVWFLCNKIEPGPLNQDIGAVVNVSRNSTQKPSCPVESRPRDDRACGTILRILKLCLPFFFLADGFSSKSSTIMGVTGASRLTTAFMMSLVRKNLVSSPIGWLSWAIQVLLATAIPACLFLDILVLIVGSSSIRLVRHLEAQRVYERRKHKKHYD